MKVDPIHKRTLIMSSIIAGALLMSGCSSDDDDNNDDDNGSGSANSSVRIIHTSSDAPPVDVKLNQAVAVSGLDYPSSTGFVSVDSGNYDIAVDAIVPGGNLEGVISVDDFAFEQDQRYTIVAIDDTATISEFVAEESATTPSANEVSISVLHAATSVKGADVAVYVTAPGADISSVAPNFSFDFKGQVDAGALPTGQYQIRVVAGGDTANPAYDSGTIDLSGFGGQKLLLVAVNTVNSTTQLASPVKLMAYTDTAQVELLDARTNTGARVVHLSPDAGTAAGGPVEVFASSTALPVSPTELIPSFSYTETVPGLDSFVDVPAGDYVFDVSPDGTGIGGSVYTSSSISLTTGMEYTVVAAGYILTTPAFDLLATQDKNRSIITQASVKVIHGAPLAGTVDVFVTPADAFTKEEVESGAAGAPLLDDFTFGTITDYVAVPPGDYDIRVVTDAGAGVAAIDFEDFNLAAGSVSTVIAREPIDTGIPSDFGVLVLTN